MEEMLYKRLDEEKNKIKENDKFIFALHGLGEFVTASLWEKERSPKEKDHYSYIEYNDISHGEKVTMEQDEYCRYIQMHLRKMNGF